MAKQTQAATKPAVAEASGADFKPVSQFGWEEANAAPKTKAPVKKKARLGRFNASKTDTLKGAEWWTEFEKKITIIRVQERQATAENRYDQQFLAEWDGFPEHECEQGKKAPLYNILYRKVDGKLEFKAAPTKLNEAEFYLTAKDLSNA